MLTIADIPDEYRKGDSDGENITHLASGVTDAIHNTLGEAGSDALKRFGQAGFVFRSGEIGRTMIRSSSALSNPLRETPQFVDFGGGALAATALAGAVDLTAAALCRLFVGQSSARRPDWEADVGNFPGEEQLPQAAHSWLIDTRCAHEWADLKALRDQYVHRLFPMHITITLGAPNLLHEPEIKGVKRQHPQVLDESRTFVIDWLVTAGLLMNEQAKSEGLPS